MKWEKERENIKIELLIEGEIELVTTDNNGEEEESGGNHRVLDTNALRNEGRKNRHRDRWFNVPGNSKARRTFRNNDADDFGGRSGSASLVVPPLKLGGKERTPCICRPPKIRRGETARDYEDNQFRGRDAKEYVTKISTEGEWCVGQRRRYHLLGLDLPKSNHPKSQGSHM